MKEYIVTQPWFPSYVHSVVDESDTTTWPVGGQGWNECSFTSVANALNLLEGTARYAKEEFLREASVLFQPRLGGTLPPLKAWQLRQRGYGAHFGNLSHTNAELVLRSLIDHTIPTIVDIYTSHQFGLTRIYGQHAVVLVGYSEPFFDAQGVRREEYYVIDPEWPALGQFDMRANDIDRDGDGVPEPYPGNRTLDRHEFLRVFTTRNYCPVFPTPAAHAAWYDTTLRRARPRIPIIGNLLEWLFFGSDDRIRD